MTFSTSRLQLDEILNFFPQIIKAHIGAEWFHNDI